MNIKKLLLTVFFLSVSIGSFAAWQQETKRGWQIGAANNRMNNSTNNLDYQCVEECTHSGYGHPMDVCQRRCTF